MFAGSMQPLKAESIFDYNISQGPITSDGNISGWMFCESRVTDNIEEFKSEFLDQAGHRYRRDVDALTGYLEPPPWT